VATVSYDSSAILKDFAGRHKIDIPLLADPGSVIIRSFRVLNGEAGDKEKGMASPGFFFIDAGGAIREKYFEQKYDQRFTANNVISKLFPELTEQVTGNVEAPHLKLSLAQTDEAIVAGNRVSLIADIELPPDVHVYAPGVQGYKPVVLLLHPSSGLEFAAARYPPAKILYLPAIKEKVPVFEGKFRISQDVTVTSSLAGAAFRAVFSSAKTVTISGELTYQACDQTTCFVPASVLVMWHLQVLPLDLKRSPDSIRHR
jgi:Disulphide bond corrector protein DsbC/AhpC/TSA family